ncbi:hypothetical protein K7432_001574 [Basidiobolus ranarum]|uniref:PIN domain-containing protein n=1 Tax=Basidiobolus ranarum TaxID=34480 RepID=A0ABR2X2W2_9FUNG
MQVFSRGEKKGNASRLWAPDSQPTVISNKKVDGPSLQATQNEAPSKTTSQAKQASNQKESSTPLQKYCGELKKLEQQVGHYVEKMQYPNEWEKTLSFHARLTSVYRKVITLDYEFSVKHDIEQRMWKLGFYSIIEKFRKLIQSDQDVEWNRRHLVDVFQTFLKQSGHFYSNLLSKTQRSMERCYSSTKETEQSNHGQKRISQYKQSYHRSITFLGDIARYKTMYSGLKSKNWSLAKSIYTKAAALSPNNGKSYNQMAIIATYEKNPFDNVYFYYRSLSVPHPFISARESLAIIFEQNRQHLVEKVGSKQRVEKFSSTMRKKTDAALFKPDGEGLQLLYDIFVRIQGILFTKISMETFPELRNLVLYLFEHALDHESGFASMRTNDAILKMETMSFFNLYGFSVPEPPDFSSKDMMAYATALVFLLDFSILIMKACSTELNHQSTSNNSIKGLASNERIVSLLQYVALLARWLVLNIESWIWINEYYDNDAMISLYPEFPQTFKQFWSCMTLLANSLKQLSSNFEDKPLLEYEDFEIQQLPEFKFINGFAPLCENSPNTIHLYLEPLSDLFTPFDASESDFSGSSDSEEEESPYEESIASSQDTELLHIRVLSILKDLDYLAALSKPEIFHYDSFSHMFETSLISKTPPTEMSPSKAPHRVISIDITKPKAMKQIEPENFSEEEGDEKNTNDLEVLDEMVEEIRKEIHSKISLETDDPDNDTIGNLKARKDELLALTELRSQMQLENPRKTAHGIRLKSDYTIVIFDTNNFVSELRLIQRLHRTQKFVISVPLVVFTELEGLKKNTRSTLGPKAQRALEWLESEFLQQRNQAKTYLRAQTSKGNFLRDITLRNELWHDQTDGVNISARSAINDDVILQCCLYFINNNQESGYHNPVVLVTNDVNMRLKGYAKYIPVATVFEFRKRLRIDCGINISR